MTAGVVLRGGGGGDALRRAGLDRRGEEALRDVVLRPCSSRPTITSRRKAHRSQAVASRNSVSAAAPLTPRALAGHNGGPCYFRGGPPQSADRRRAVTDMAKCSADLIAEVGLDAGKQ